MYQYVKDKEFLKKSYSVCADLVNQLVQELKSYGIQAKMSTVGSKKRGLITQNGCEPIDYDFNLWISSAEEFDIQREPKRLKQEVIEAFDFVLSKNGWEDCEDSTSALPQKSINWEAVAEYRLRLIYALSENHGKELGIDSYIKKLGTLGRINIIGRKDQV